MGARIISGKNTRHFFECSYIFAEAKDTCWMSYLACLKIWGRDKIQSVGAVGWSHSLPQRLSRKGRGAPKCTSTSLLPLWSMWIHGNQLHWEFLEADVGHKPEWSNQEIRKLEYSFMHQFLIFFLLRTPRGRKTNSSGKSVSLNGKDLRKAAGWEYQLYSLALTDLVTRHR